ncbi:hypothetical protein [Trinickia fusca]|nr:hypothetical protein [Trinickia fusca]
MQHTQTEAHAAPALRARLPQGTLHSSAGALETSRGTQVDHPVPASLEQALAMLGRVLPPGPRPSPAQVRNQVENALDVVEQNLTEDEQAVRTTTQALLNGNFAHNPELANLIASGAGDPGLFAKWATMKPRDQQNVLLRFLSDVANNNFENKASAVLTSLFNMTAKSAFCVMAMTTARQGADHALNDDSEFSQNARAVLGTAAMVVPMALLAAGGARDINKGTATTWSTLGRSGLLLAGGASLAMTAAWGNLGAAGADMLAFCVGYCLSRDVGQLFVRTPGQTGPLQFAPTLVAGLEYGGVEEGVNTLMSYHAQGKTGNADALRGAINGGGEFFDNVNLEVAHLVAEGAQKTEGGMVGKALGGAKNIGNMRNRLSLQVPTGAEVTNMLFGSYAGRAVLFGIAVLAATNFQMKTPKLDPQAETNDGNAMGAAILALLYTAFAGIFAQRDPNATRGDDMEMGVRREGPETPTANYQAMNDETPH